MTLLNICSWSGFVVVILLLWHGWCRAPVSAHLTAPRWWRVVLRDGSSHLVYDTGAPVGFRRPSGDLLWGLPLHDSMLRSLIEKQTTWATTLAAYPPPDTSALPPPGSGSVSEKSA